MSEIGEGDVITRRVLEALVADGFDLFGTHRLGSVEDLIDHAPPVVTWGTDPPACTYRSGRRDRRIGGFGVPIRRSHVQEHASLGKKRPIRLFDHSRCVYADAS